MKEQLYITQVLEKYKRNMDRQRELDELLQTHQSKREWISCLQNRARENQQMYQENGELIDCLEGWLTNPLDEEDAAFLYQQCYSMYWEEYDDSQVLLPIIKKLISYYKEHEDVAKLLFLYGAAYYEINEVQNRRQGQGAYDISILFHIIAYKKDYEKLDADSRYRIWRAYYNLIVSGLANKSISPQEAYEYYKEVMSFWSSPALQRLDGKCEKIQDIVNRIEREWLIIEDGIEECCEEAKQVFCDCAEKIYLEETEKAGNGIEINSEVYAAYLRSKHLQGSMTADEIVDEYFDFYLRQLKLCPEVADMTDEDLYFVMNTPIILEDWLHLGIAEEKSKRIMDVLKQQTQESWYDRMKNYASFFVNEIMTEWCFKLIKYMGSQGEKEECMFQLLVKRQLPTYLHSVMVTHLAVALSEEVLRVCPELFDSLEGMKGEQITNFVKECALLHDIGKTKITDIVNTQGRRLGSAEFDGIRQHPTYGAEMVEQDSDLMKYKDVILGHHKFYDGSGGYPEAFDNTASPYRIIIDLITICDCIDAATDHLGRNYKRAKTLQQVLGELTAEKGTRYHPGLVEVIEQSESLQEKMSYIVSEGRLDIMYQAYSDGSSATVAQ